MSELGWKYLTASDKDAILRGIRDGVAYGGPYHVEIHPADRCNIECFFCSTAAIRGTDELPEDRFVQLIGELRQAGTRAIRFSGGGEPLFHRKIKNVLAAVVASGIPIENLTTNGVLLSEDISSLLLKCCDQVTISLNTYGAESWARTMKSPERNYSRVLDNIRRLAAMKRGAGKKTPVINIQFLVWRENYRDIRRMYDLAVELGADTILFSGLAYLKPEERMTEDEYREMLGLYEEVIRIDEFRRIANIGSLERDLSADLSVILKRVSDERRAQPLVKRLLKFVTREGSLREKVTHHLRSRRNARADQATAGFDAACIMGWYSMLIRSSGVVAPCCILQHKQLGHIMRDSAAHIWRGAEYQEFRKELTRIIALRREWHHSDEKTVEAVCSVAGTDLCPMKSFYFVRDVPFVTGLNGEFSNVARALNPRT